MSRDEFDPGGVVERMKIIIIDFFFLFAFFDIRCMERKNRTGEYERERERERRKEGKRELPYVYTLTFPQSLLTYLTLGYSGYLTLLYFASLYFTFCLVECSKELHRYIHGLTCTYLYLLLSNSVYCIYKVR